MTFQHMCALCSSHADVEYHSTYMGHPIVKGVSWITRSTHWHSNEMDANTLKELRARIRKMEGVSA